MFAVYPPIYMVNHFGERPGQLLGALLVSAGNGLLFGAPVAGRLAARFGLRRPIIGALLGMGLLTILAGLLYDWPLAVNVCVLSAAAGAVKPGSLGRLTVLASV